MTGCNGNVRALEQRDFLVKWAHRLGCLLVLVGVIFAGAKLYGGWRKENLSRQAKQFVAQRDFASAVLVARRLLELDENNLAACRAMAEMAEASGSPDAINWRKKIAQIEPSVAGNQFALARTALRFAQPDLAENVLEALPETARQSVDYHQVAATAALLRDHRAEAEKHFADALELSPQDPHLSLNLSVLRLTSSSSEVRNEARANLVRLTEQSTVRIESVRALATDALAQKDQVNARQWAIQLKAESDATFSDSLLFLQTVESAEENASVLHDLEEKAAASPGATAELITWLNRHDQAQAAADWSSHLPSAIAEAQPVPLAIAESYSFLQDWKGLHNLVDGKYWGDFEALRFAVQSHALHRLSPADRPSMQTQTIWRAALKAAREKPELLLAIAQLADGWGYKADAEQAWWMLASGNDNPKEGLSALQHLYQATQNTRGLFRVAKRALELDPNDLVAANNSASFGLLLSNDSTARRLAQRLHSDYPANRAFAATCAYALHTEGRSAEGLKLLESLKEEELRYPAIAAYYVVLLVENGKFERARLYLGNAKRATLLPEERQLLSTATSKLLVDEKANPAKSLATSTP